jgi:hypothetical protein
MLAVALGLAVAGACGFEWKMVQLPGGLYVDPATDERARAAVSQAWTTGAEKVRDFYGSLRSDLPDGYFCNSDTCRVYFSGKYMRSSFMLGMNEGDFLAARQSIIIAFIDERMPRVIAHEIAHSELEERIAPNPVPAWFNEGLATYVAGEPACPRNMPDGVADLRPLTEGNAWMSNTNGPRGHAIYCQAMREVTAWLAKNGKPGLERLLLQIKDGTRFSVAYGPMAIQP